LRKLSFCSTGYVPAMERSQTVAIASRKTEYALNRYRDMQAYRDGNRHRKQYVATWQLAKMFPLSRKKSS
jgi:hypothetical protein